MFEQAKDKRVFSGIQPSGVFTLGNYVGAVRNWGKMQQQFNCLYCIVDLHAITVRQNPAQLRKRSYEAAAMLLAAGINPKESILFLQSTVPQHAELAWVLSCNAMFGELTRMTQFKDKSKKHEDNINSGLFTYPVLMAADILLYNTNAVPVGGDQKQHVELARNIAQRFNNAYSETFTVPQPYIPKTGARIMSLQNPSAKMSKSDENVNAFVSMADDKDTIIRKFKRAVTDNEARVYAGENKPGITNLINIYATLNDKTIAQTEAEFAGAGYGEFKIAVAECVAATFAPIQAKYSQLLADKQMLNTVLKQGSNAAQQIAQKTLAKVYHKVGFAQI